MTSGFKALQTDGLPRSDDPWISPSAWDSQTLSRLPPIIVTNGGVETSLNYYRNAGIELDEKHLLSCDSLKIAKPDVKVYQNAQSHLTQQGLGTEEDGKRWFVAAHAWDLISARKAGFKTAFLDFEEHDPVTEVFGEFDLYAGSMKELLEKMKEMR